MAGDLEAPAAGTVTAEERSAALTAAAGCGVAQRAAPESRIVYVDHDPVVISHARALLTSRPACSCMS